MPATRRSRENQTDRLRQRFADLARTSVSFRVGSYRCDMIWWGVIAPRWWRNWLHAHSFFEPCYAYRGQGTFRILGEEHRVRAGDLFLAKPREHHEVVSARNSPLGIYFWSFALTPTGAKALAPGDEVLNTLLKRFLEAGRPVARVGPTYERTLLLLSEEIAAAGPGHMQSIHALALKLLLDTVRSVTDTSGLVDPAPPPAANNSSETAQVILRYLQDNFAQRTEVRDVASQVHMSERHVSRLFRQAMGTSILGYLTRLRIDTACRLLLENQMSIKQVARAVGYPDAHYFTTLFGRYMGVTPAAYRRSGGESAISSPRPIRNNHG